MTSLGRRALRMALQLRRNRSVPRESSINAVDVALGLGITVRFLDKKSLDGMYCQNPGPHIFLPCTAHRPAGRIMFSCAHEIGHHMLSHGTHVDEYLDNPHLSRPSSPEERAANIFASYLLMPRPAVLGCFTRRGWEAENPTPAQIYRASVELGVGYSTLINHLGWSLEILPRHRMDTLLKVQPKDIRSEIIERDLPGPLVVLDKHWVGSAVDLEVGGLLAISNVIEESVPGMSDEGVANGWRLLRAKRQGISKLNLWGSPWRIRIARSGYCGSARYRHMEDADGD